MPSHNNRAIIAAAGSRKTQFIVEQALVDPSKRVLVTTYTNENLRHLASRLAHGNGVVPSHVTLVGWFSFLMNECARPYQRALLKQPNLIRSLNFEGSRKKYTPRLQTQQFFLDSNHDIYCNGVSHFVCEVERVTGGLVVKRLSEMFDHIYIDEIQDVVGHDLDFLDCLMGSSLALTVVGDPRQHTYSTNTSNRNKNTRVRDCLIG
jgi:superfamily I DNA/RNA helicase